MIQGLVWLQRQIGGVGATLDCGELHFTHRSFSLTFHPTTIQPFDSTQTLPYVGLPGDGRGSIEARFRVVEATPSLYSITGLINGVLTM